MAIRCSFGRGELGWSSIYLSRPCNTHLDTGDNLGAPDDLEGLACVAAARGETERAARLFGASEALPEAMGAPPESGESALQEPYLAAARSQLDEASWQEAWAQGRAMTLEEAISYALEEEEAGG